MKEVIYLIFIILALYFQIKEEYRKTITFLWLALILIGL